MLAVPMTLIKRKNSQFWYVQFQMHGRTYIRSSKTSDKRIAAKVEGDWKAKVHAQRYLGHQERITLKAAMLDFCESKIGTANHRNLMIQMRNVSRLMPIGKYLDELTSADLERFKRDRQLDGVGGQSIKHGFLLIGGAIKRAKKLGYLAGEFHIPEVALAKHPLRYLTKNEEIRLLAELDPRREGNGLRSFNERSDTIKREMQDAYDLVVLLLDTGARYSEIANIGWSRIDLLSRTIQLWRPKVRNETTLFMTERVYAVLARRLASKAGEHVFSNKQGGPRGYASIAIRKAIRRAGLTGVRIHTLRHTHASRLVQNGMSVYEVREILGHTDIKTTMRYAHLEQRDVASKARDVMNRLNDGTS
ncbi:tyrosine-type recombinase/integrase [Stenotrophobium rhamnosiphilum]|uniref:Site-specific integrase n=1 Tax=Stenotrophobium rhamnosiphilum TaxID=2029166 RepID=A0A2T5MB31_9GAMM|nr:site-specific integrase [Stenotrophobium rhamnosiphilum]PTU27722.1 site-specific integrase [Stenotrophobium rhamnosiphilum]